MKNLISFLVLLALTAQSFAQKNNDAQRISQEEIEQLRHKAKWQLTTALVMTGVGTAMMITGLAIAANSNSESADNTAGALFVSGVLLDLGSLGFSIPSHVNRVKAKRASLALTSQRMPGNTMNGSLKLKSQPALTLSIPLSR